MPWMLAMSFQVCSTLRALSMRPIRTAKFANLAFVDPNSFPYVAFARAQLSWMIAQFKR